MAIAFTARERLEDELAHNTVLTTLTILEEKGYVGHTALEVEYVKRFRIAWGR